MLNRADSGGAARKRTPAKTKQTIGWAERIACPEWGIEALEAKVDTGAASSALHVEDLRFFKNGRCEFRIVVDLAQPDNSVVVRAPVLKRARVRSSNGEYTRRCFVLARVQIGPVLKEIELSLVSREKMLFRMLLGRKALEHDFVVDVSRRHILA
jgi:hypothetical protein